MTITADEVMARESAHVLQTYRRAPVVFERGSGCRLLRRGRPRLSRLHLGDRRLVARPRASAAGRGDCRAGRAAAAHVEPLLPSAAVGSGDEARPRLSGLPRAFFCNSGTEAVEACLKFARRYWFTQGHAAHGRSSRFERAFHGRTMGALSMTWDEHYRTPFGPLLDGVTFVSNSDPSELAGGGVGEDRRDHRRAAAGRRRAFAPSAAEMAAAIEAACEHSRARCSSPTKCSAASAAPACPFYSADARADSRT